MEKFEKLAAILGIIVIGLGLLLMMLLVNDYIREYVDSRDFAQFAQQNHCYIFEYDQHPDGTIQKRWSCQNDADNQDDSNADEE